MYCIILTFLSAPGVSPSSGFPSPSLFSSRQSPCQCAPFDSCRSSIPYALLKMLVWILHTHRRDQLVVEDGIGFACRDLGYVLPYLLLFAERTCFIPRVPFRHCSTFHLTHGLQLNHSKEPNERCTMVYGCHVWVTFAISDLSSTSHVNNGTEGYSAFVARKRGM